MDAVAHEFWVFGEGDPNCTVVQLPGWDMLGRNHHGGRIPTHGGKGRGKGGGKGGKGGVGLAALANGPHAPPGAALWERNGWTQPGQFGLGTVTDYVTELRSGFVYMDDGGPDVHFNPEHLEPPLDDMLQADTLIHTKVLVKVIYRPNGRSRHTDLVRGAAVEG